ncbi:MAG: hypothetical protein IAF02_10280 [Anaerolineae bacterium]|nr:hypothetical protein [Anaerolineae bacterium]
MIRPFALRDLALVSRLSENAVSLHTESALTLNPHPVRDALISMVSGDYPTLICKHDESGATGFIQLQVQESSPHAHVFFLGNKHREPQKNGDSDDLHLKETIWLALLDQAVAEMGSRGVYSLVAEVNETGDDFPILRRAGFVVYTRQDIWVLDSVDTKFHSTLLLSPRQSEDDWDIQLLYANTVPRLVQLVEPLPPLTEGEGWVLREDGELVAFVHISTGSIASWMRLFVHPNADSWAQDILTVALRRVMPTPTHPVFCCVRRYQSWLQRPLERTGFSLLESQAVMVRHTVQHQKKGLSEATAVLETQGIPASAPMVRRYQLPKQNGKTNSNDRTT